MTDIDFSIDFHFSANFLMTRAWLTACEETQALYCFPCLLFSKKRSGPWVDTGYKNLSHLSAALDRHEGKTTGGRGNGSSSSNSHRDAEIELKLFLKNTCHTQPGTIANMSSEEIQRYNCEVRRNQEIVKRLVSATMYLAKEEIAFRGHDERVTSDNRGPYKELLR